MLLRWTPYLEFVDYYRCRCIWDDVWSLIRVMEGDMKVWWIWGYDNGYLGVDGGDMFVRVAKPIKLGKGRRFETFKNKAPRISSERGCRSISFVSSRGLASCCRCLMLWTSSSNVQLWRHNSSMTTHISSMAPTSPVSMTPLGVGDETLLFTMTGNS